MSLPPVCTPAFRARPPLTSTRIFSVLLALAFATLTLPAQSLARPGWAGSGLTVERWWKHAVIVDFPNSAVPPNAETLDTLRTLGVDAILLRGLAPAGPETGSASSADAAAETNMGTDDLFREASRRSLRVLVELPAGRPAADLAATARSWAARGAAGFLVPSATPDALRSVRSALHAIPGERLLISSVSVAAGSPPPTNATGELQLVSLPGLSSQTDTAQLRAALAALPSTPLITTDDHAASTPVPSKLARVDAAAVLLLTPGASLLQRSWLGIGDGAASVPAPPTSTAGHTPFDQLRQFAALHHDRPAFRDGLVTPLDHAPEGAAVWIRRGPAGSVLVVVCNLRASPLRLSLTDDLARLHLRGTFFKTVSRSDAGLGGMSLSAVTVPPFGVYIGELSR